jgi:hypothetical protein
MLLQSIAHRLSRIFWVLLALVALVAVDMGIITEVLVVSILVGSGLLFFFVFFSFRMFLVFAYIVVSRFASS